jgi:hypothetical protein
VDRLTGPVVVVVPADRLPGAELGVRGVFDDPVRGAVGVVEGVLDGRTVGKLDLFQRAVGSQVLVRGAEIPEQGGGAFQAIQQVGVVLAQIVLFTRIDYILAWCADQAVYRREMTQLLTATVFLVFTLTAY